MKREEIIAGILEDMGAMRRFLTPSPELIPLRMPTRAQIEIMLILAHEGTQSIKQLAQKLCMSSSAATQVVNALVQDKLLARKEDAYDRRKICVTLTLIGKKRLEEAKKCRLTLMTKLYESLNLQELSTLMRLQKKILTNFKQ